MSGQHYQEPRIPRTLDDGYLPDWLEYTDEPWGLVHMGDAVDIYPDMLDGDKASGRIISVKYEPSGELSMLLLSDILTDERWVDYPGAIYHHKKDED